MGFLDQINPMGIDLVLLSLWLETKPCHGSGHGNERKGLEAGAKA